MTALRLLGLVWMAPATVLAWLAYLLPAWALGRLRFDGWERWGVARFVVTSRGRLHSWLWARWAGLALPCAIVLHDANRGTVRHELRHIDQWLLLGPFFPLVYGALLLTHGYSRHPLEVDARRAAARPAS